MQEPPMAHNEAARIAALCSTGQLDTPIEGRFEIITRLARSVMDVPIAAVSLIDADRQWFKSINGLHVTQTDRDISFCAHTILSDEIMIVPDARRDPRFSDNPLVTGPPNIVFYLGCPIIAPCGSNIATLCLIDTKPRKPSDQELASVRGFAAIVQQQLNATAQKSVATELLATLSAEQRNTMIDPLTRLWNRNGIEKILTRQIYKAKENRLGISLMAVRVDFSNNGTEPQDRSIQDHLIPEIARSILIGTRQWDNVGRYECNDFVVVMGEDADEQYAIESAEWLRNQINEHTINTRAGDIQAQVTLGVVYAPPGFTSSNRELIDLASVALNRAESSVQDGIFVGTSRYTAA